MLNGIQYHYYSLLTCFEKEKQKSSNNLKRNGENFREHLFNTNKYQDLKERCLKPINEFYNFYNSNQSYTDKVQVGNLPSSFQAQRNQNTKKSIKQMVSLLDKYQNVIFLKNFIKFSRSNIDYIIDPQILQYIKVQNKGDAFKFSFCQKFDPQQYEQYPIVYNNQNFQLLILYILLYINNLENVWDITNLPLYNYDPLFLNLFHDRENFERRSLQYANSKKSLELNKNIIEDYENQQNKSQILQKHLQFKKQERFHLFSQHQLKFSFIEQLFIQLSEIGRKNKKPKNKITYKQIVKALNRIPTV